MCLQMDLNYAAAFCKVAHFLYKFGVSFCKTYTAVGTAFKKSTNYST